VIRCPVNDIGVKGRRTQGVKVLTTADDEHVVSVERISEDGADENGEGTPS
jgi:DNA gyrase subunit A